MKTLKLGTAAGVCLIASEYERLLETLRSHGWLPGLPELVGLNSDRDETQNLREKDWPAFERMLESAIARRDFISLENLASAADFAFTKEFVRLVTHQIKGEVGECFDLVKSFEEKKILDGLPEDVLLQVLRYDARCYSIAGHPRESLRLHQKLRSLERWRELDVVQQVTLLRDDLNFSIQCADSPTTYYDENSPVLQRFDSVLKECLSATGSNLEKARSFDPVIGPAVICMKEYREWIRHHKKDQKAAQAALVRQREAIRLTCKENRRLGPIRFSPLANQYIRSGNWGGAKDVLAEQREQWKRFDSSPETNNRFEFGIYSVLSGIVNGFGFGLREAALRDFNSARVAFSSTRTSRFQSDIAYYKEQMLAGFKQTGTKREGAKLNQRLLGEATGYYFFAQS